MLRPPSVSGRASRYRRSDRAEISLDTGDEGDSLRTRAGRPPPPWKRGTGAVRTGRPLTVAKRTGDRQMHRRGLMGVVAALVLTAFAGVSANALDAKPKAKSGCACCGAACNCPACTCDASAKAGTACDCCSGSACCSATKVKKTEKTCCAAKPLVAAKAKTACVCCGEACGCPACSCDVSAKAGAACDCCGGLACCNAANVKAISAAIVG